MDETSEIMSQTHRIVGQLDSRAAILEDLASLGSLRPSGASAQVCCGIPVIRIKLSGRRNGRTFRRTVNAGVDPFTQLMCSHGVPDASAAELRVLWKEEADLLRGLVLEACQKAVNDERLVGEARRRFGEHRRRRISVEHSSLVTMMSDLISKGWTRDMLMSAVNECEVKDIMEG